MTCVVGLVHKGKVYMGGDSAGISGYDVTVRSDAKVFKNNQFIIGYTSSFRMGQVLRFKFKPPKVNYKDIYKYMCTTFIDEVRKDLKKAGWLHVSNSVEKGGSFLVGYKGVLYSIDSDFQVGISLDQYDAVGCGASLALGSLYSTKSLDPITRINTALQAAEKFNAGVRGPFVICKEK